MTAADKPRADLVALFDAFASRPDARGYLTLFGDETGEVLQGWAAVNGHRVEERPMYNVRQGRWTMLEARLAGGTISVHLDSVQETAPADQRVLARVQAALDGEQPECWTPPVEKPLKFSPGGPGDFACMSCGETMQSYDQFEEYQHDGCGGLVKRKQPEAAEGSV